MDSARGVQTSLWTGCPIRILRAHRSCAAPPERFAGLRVLHRPSAPRHPPRTLSCLWFPFDHSIVHRLIIRCSLPFLLVCLLTISWSTVVRSSFSRFLMLLPAEGARPLAFLCFSLLALGKIEVIILLQL